MNITGAKRQTIFLTVVNAVVRALGLLMRIGLSRLLGAEVIGVMELSQSVHMTAIAPLTSGLPLAISRMTAKAADENKTKPLLAGLWLARMGSIILIPLLWMLSPHISRAMGDTRVLPSLWFTAPCILVLGYSASCNGYCYGIERGTLPAISELIEQISRILFTAAFLFLLPHLTIAWMAALPTAATLFAEVIGLWYVLKNIGIKKASCSESIAYRKPILRLAIPTAVNRMVGTLFRSITAIVIPLQLRAAGISHSQATAQLGMLNGMVIPILMLPCIFTSALSMVLIPRVAMAEENPSEIQRLLWISLFSCVPFSLACSAIIWAFAPFLASRIYRLPELTVLFQLCAPLTVLFAFNHLAGSILSGLGLQKNSLYSSCFVSSISLVLICFLARTEKLTGVIKAQYAGQFLSLICNMIILIRWHQKRSHS